MKKEIEKKVETINTHVSYYCDICGKELEDRGENINIVQIEVIQEYHSYPECGWKKGYAFDFCRECFERDIFPHIKAEHRPVDIEW